MSEKYTQSISPNEAQENTQPLNETATVESLRVPEVSPVVTRKLGEAGLVNNIGDYHIPEGHIK